MALGGTDWTSDQRGYLEVVDLVTVQTFIQVLLSGHVCNLQWLDSEHILYSTFESQCDVLSNTPIETWLLNTITGSQDKISGGDIEPVWLLSPTKLLMAQ